MAYRNCLAAFVLSVLSVASAAPAFAGPEPPAGWTDGYVFANGIRIHYWRTGARQAAARARARFVRRRARAGRTWRKRSRTATTSSCSTPGGTACPIRRRLPMPADVQVEDLAGLIKELKLERPILMGHSMGSASVAHFAAKYPDVPRAVILEDPALVRPAAPCGTPQATAAPVDERRATILARNNTTEATLVAGCMKNSPKWGRRSARPGRRRNGAITRPRRRSPRARACP